MAFDLKFLPGVNRDHIVSRLNAAGGKEIESGKLTSSQSSAALAVNTFGWFVERPHLLPPLPGLAHAGVPTMVDVEYCARFPWPGGRHPWLDAIVQTNGYLVGVESKRFEPYRDQKTVSLSTAYDRPVWGDGMQPFERMRDQLRSGEVHFHYLDATQLVKHAFGLVTDARRRGLSPALFYLYAEPEHLDGVAIPTAAFENHRREVDDFTTMTLGAEVEFSSASCRGWLDTWDATVLEVAAHSQAVVSTFAP